MNFEYVNKFYGVNAAIGRRVIVNGKPGTIIRDCGNYIGVNFDDEKPGRIGRCHPTWEVQYLDEFREPRKMTRSQKNYQKYLSADLGCTFSEWLGLKRRMNQSSY